MTFPKAPESFDEARKRFSEFLGENGYPENVLWVDCTSLVWDKRKLWVRDDPATLRRARQRYENGIRAGLGVFLEAVAIAGSTTVAAVLLPLDDDAAQRHMVPSGGLKLSALKNMFKARVSGHLLQTFLSLLHRNSSRLFVSGILELS
jgi:hypothetical protein